MTNHHPNCEDATGAYPGSCTCKAIAVSEERKVLVARLRSVDVSWSETGEWCAEAADQIEADGQRIAELEAETSKIVALAGEWMGDIEYAQFKHEVQTCDQFLDPDHYWYRQGKDDGIEQERGNIVEWLLRRAPAALHDPRMVAGAIEAGEHLK